MQNFNKNITIDAEMLENYKNRLEIYDKNKILINQKKSYLLPLTAFHTPHPPHILVYYEHVCFLRRLQKDARRKTMQIGGTNASRALTATRLVTKTMTLQNLKLPTFGATPPCPN